MTFVSKAKSCTSGEECVRAACAGEGRRLNQVVSLPIFSGEHAIKIG